MMLAASLAGMIGVFPGSFDPLTVGHCDLVEDGGVLDGRRGRLVLAVGDVRVVLHVGGAGGQ